MLNYIKALYHIFLNYHILAIPILLYEIYFNFKYDKNLNKFKYLKSNFLSDSIPCPYFFLKKIKTFIIKNNIYTICDLGSGYGKILYFFGKINTFEIDGVELDTEIYHESKIIENKNIQVVNQNILDYKLDKKNYDLFILNDPLKKLNDLQILIDNIIRIKKNYFIVFINLTEDKLAKVSSNFQIMDKYIVSKNKNIYFCKSC